MAWTSGFFNSIDGDRLYNADQMSELFDGLITQGVYEAVGNKLAVQPNSGMTIQINTGRGWFGSRWVKNDTEYLLTLEKSDVLLNRYAAIGIRADLADGARKAEPFVKYSPLATNPTKPTMERTEFVKEYCLAYVLIKGGATAITAADIEDTRGNTSLCGWVTGLIKQVNTTTLWEQWQAQFRAFMANQDEEATDREAAFSEFLAAKQAEFSAWFNGLQEVLSANAETQIAADLTNLKNQLKKITITFDGLGWDRQDDGRYIQTVAAPGVTATNDLIITPTKEFKAVWVSQGITDIAQATNSITFETYHPEDVNMTATVIIMTI